MRFVRTTIAWAGISPAPAVCSARPRLQFRDAKVNSPLTIALREEANPIVDSAITTEQVDMTITLKDGRKLHKFIAPAVGSTEVPMTDQQFEKKFSDLDGILPPDRTRALLDKCSHAEALPSAADMALATLPH